MKTFRGLINKYPSNSFLERIKDSIWWGNQFFILKNDPDLFRYIEKRGISKKDLFDNLDEGESRRLSFEDGSKGYSGLKIYENQFSPRISNIIEVYGSRKEDVFLSKIPLEELEFKTDYLMPKSKIILDKELNGYIIKNLSPTKLYERSGFFKYFKDNELVALCTGKLSFPCFH